MKYLAILLFVGASIAAEKETNNANQDCLYVNFDFLVSRYTYTTLTNIYKCIDTLPKNDNAIKALYNLNDFGKDMHTNLGYVKNCARTEFMFEDLRICQKPLLELVEMGAKRIIEEFKQLREHVKVNASATQQACVHAHTNWPIRHFTAALEC